VLQWADATSPVPVLELRARDETDAAASKLFGSSEDTSGGGPVLSVTYATDVSAYLQDPELSEAGADEIADHANVTYSTPDFGACPQPPPHAPTYPDIAYKSFKVSPTGVSRPIYLDEYDPVPDYTGQQFPALVLVHGMGWWRGCRTTLNEEAWDLSYGPALSHPLSQRFITFAIDYRLSCSSGDDRLGESPILPLCDWHYKSTDWGPGPGQGSVGPALHDVQDAVAWAKDHAADHCSCWNGHVALLGSSAGGNLSMQAAPTAPTGDAPDAVAGWSPSPENQVTSELPIYGCDGPPYHTQGDADESNNTRECWRATNTYIGCSIDQGPGPDPDCESDPETGVNWYEQASPINWYTSPSQPPVFFANGGFCPGTMGCDPPNPELVGWLETRDFFDHVNGITGLSIDFCEVDFPYHATQYISEAEHPDTPCAETSLTVFQRTVDFLASHST